MLAITLLTLLTAAYAIPLTGNGDDDLIPGKYIVKFSEDIHTSAIQNIKSSIVAPIDHDYSFLGFNGFAATLSPDEYTKLQKSKLVQYIQQDAIVSVKAINDQYNATWGLSRISHLENKNGSTYSYDDSAGEGTCAYVIDTGIETDHPEFEGRAQFLVDLSGENKLLDGLGHGTHVAGTIGSLTYGVAKKTRLFAVKVLDSDGQGNHASVIAGMQYVANDAKTRAEQCPLGIVVNMSIGGSKSDIVNEAAEALLKTPLFLATASGNDALPASLASPASSPLLCTIAATTPFDQLSPYSNWGPLVDLLAPGDDVKSTWLNGSTNVISGTSMATPHVVGLAAYLLGFGELGVQGLCEVMQGMAGEGVVDLGEWQVGTPNLLVWNGVGDELRRG
ncbi:subtilisin-like protein, partial [Plenodomus tracheiphilus IPT5]